MAYVRQTPGRQCGSVVEVGITIEAAIVKLERGLSETPEEVIRVCGALEACDVLLVFESKRNAGAGIQLFAGFSDASRLSSEKASGRMIWSSYSLGSWFFPVGFGEMD